MAKKRIPKELEGKSSDDYDRKLWDNGYDQGVAEGHKQMRIKALTYLEQRYINRGIDSDDPRAQAILELARDLSKELRN